MIRLAKVFLAVLFVAIAIMVVVSGCVARDWESD